MGLAYLPDKLVSTIRLDKSTKRLSSSVVDYSYSVRTTSQYNTLWRRCRQASASINEVCDMSGSRNSGTGTSTVLAWVSSRFLKFKFIMHLNRSAH